MKRKVVLATFANESSLSPVWPCYHVCPCVNSSVAHHSKSEVPAMHSVSLFLSTECPLDLLVSRHVASDLRMILSNPMNLSQNQVPRTGTAPFRSTPRSQIWDSVHGMVRVGTRWIALFPSNLRLHLLTSADISSYSLCASAKGHARLARCTLAKPSSDNCWSVTSRVLIHVCVVCQHLVRLTLCHAAIHRFFRTFLTATHASHPIVENILPP